MAYSPALLDNSNRATSGLGSTHKNYLYMGQYLVIGIVTKISASVKYQRFRMKTEDLRSSLEKQFNKSGIYDVSEEGDYVVLKLKPEVAEPDWEMMIRDFYEICYQDDKHRCLDFEKAKGLSTLEEWLELADRKEHQGYQTVDQYCYGYRDEINGWNQYIETSQWLVGLSLDGKIVMECYDGILDFFTRLIREKLSKYRLSESLSVQICG